MDAQTSEHDSLTYEETPLIEPIKENEPKRNISSIVTAIIFFILLFIVGFWLSGVVRKYTGNFFGGTKEEITSTPTPIPKEEELGVIPTTTGDRYASWKSHQVLNGRTRAAYEGISYKLPPEVLSPTCDGSSCGSQGTYLPGGTRFTIALRGVGQVLPDYRGRIISDLYGKPFMVVDTTLVGGQSGTEFTGSFTGTTVGGYVFTQMHGYMIPITDTVSLEINHFSPSGITTDFAKDDALFDQITETLVVPVSSSEKGGVSTSSSLLQSSPSATSIVGE